MFQIRVLYFSNRLTIFAKLS